MTTHGELPTGLKLSLLWLFAILNMVFRDIHELLTAGTIEEILTGHMNGVAISEGQLVFGAFIIELVLLGFLFSSLLRPKAAQWGNLILAPLAMIGTLAVRPSDPDDYFFTAIEIAAFCVIFWLAFRWKAAPPQ